MSYPVYCLNFPQYIPSLPVAKPFYLAKGGGIGRDIFVSKAGFARVFDDFDNDHLDDERLGCIRVDHSDPLTSLYGYKLLRKGIPTYIIVVVTRNQERMFKSLQTSFALQMKVAAAMNQVTQSLKPAIDAIHEMRRVFRVDHIRTPR